MATAEWRLDEVWLTAVADPSVAGAPEHDPPRRSDLDRTARRRGDPGCSGE